MVWETVKKEMTITRIFLAVVAILLCCFLTFVLSQNTEKNQANNEKGIEMLNFFRDYLEKNESHPEHPQAAHVATPTTSPKPRKFFSVDLPSGNAKSETQITKNTVLDIGNSKHVTPLDSSTNASKNSSEPKMDLILVVDVKKKPEPEHKDSEIIDVKNTDTKHVDKVMVNHLLFSKTVRVSKVEEVFEDLMAQNVRRIIKEDRVERVEVSKNREMETIGSDFGIKDLLSL